METENSGHWFQFAKLYAIASEKRPERESDYALRSIELLGKAIAQGFKDAERLSNDEDMAPLNQREDFQELLNGLR